jgi:hypothetical protein
MFNSTGDVSTGKVSYHAWAYDLNTTHWADAKQYANATDAGMAAASALLVKYPKELGPCTATAEETNSGYRSAMTTHFEDLAQRFEANAIELSGVKASCKSGHLEETCTVTGLPLIGSIGVDAKVDTKLLTAEVDILYKGSKYPIVDLSAHNPQLCTTKIDIAKICAKIENLEWDKSAVTGTLYIGVGEPIIGTKWFKITAFNIPTSSST